LRVAQDSDPANLEPLAATDPPDHPENSRLWETNVTLGSESSFEYEVHWGLSGAAESGEPSLLEHLAEAAFARLGAESEADFLG